MALLGSSRFLPLFLIILSFSTSNSIIVGRCTRRREGSRCQAPNADWQYDGVCTRDNQNDVVCHVPPPRDFSFMLVVSIEVRPGAKGAKPINKLWIRGSGPGLSWERTREMRMAKENYWTLDINYTSSSNALLCVIESQCTLNQGALEFRVYRDEHGMDGMLGPNMYLKLPVSNSMVTGDKFSAPYSFFYPWFDSQKITSHDLEYQSLIHYQPFNRQIKEVSLLLPPSFRYNVNKRYPVVIFFGQNTLSKILIPLLESMYVHESNIEESIVLVYHSYFQTPYCTLNPFRLSGNRGLNSVVRCRTGLTAECRACLTCLDRSRAEFCTREEFSRQAKRCTSVYFTPKNTTCAGYATDILDIIENEILPDVAIRTLGRAMIDYPKERINVMGVEGGGLLSCFAALFRPSIYKNAACISATFHWPLTSLEVMQSRVNEGIGQLINEVTEKMKIRKEYQFLYSTQKYYIDVGEFDNRFFPIIDPHNFSDWVVEQLKQRLKVDPRNIVYFRNVLGAGNDITHIRAEGDYRILDRVKIPLLLFLKPEGGYNADYPRLPQLTSRDYVSRRMDLGVSLTKANGSISIRELEEMAKGSYEDCENIIRTSSPLRISVPIYIVSVGKDIRVRNVTCMYYAILMFNIGGSVLLATVLSIVLMEIRYHNKRATVEEDVLSSSDEEEIGMELKKNK